MRKEVVGLLTLGVLWSAGGVLAQELPMKVKGGHQLGETAEQFFAEGHEKEVLSACAAGDFKFLKKSDKRQAKKYCGEVTDARQQAMSAERSEYKTGDDSDKRADTFTFDGGRLAKVELLFSAPSAEFNYRGHTFADIFAGTKQAYGPPTTESTSPMQDVYGVPYLAHRELWVAAHAAIIITEKPGRDGSTTLVALTRAEYDRTIAAGPPKVANPLE
jgi:cation transport regulator ChaB